MLYEQAHFLGRLTCKWVNGVDSELFAYKFWEYIDKFTTSNIVIDQTTRDISNTMSAQCRLAQSSGAPQEAEAQEAQGAV